MYSLGVWKHSAVSKSLNTHRRLGNICSTSLGGKESLKMLAILFSYVIEDSVIVDFVLKIRWEEISRLRSIRLCWCWCDRMCSLLNSRIRMSQGEPEELGWQGSKYIEEMGTSAEGVLELLLSMWLISVVFPDAGSPKTTAIATSLSRCSRRCVAWGERE